MDYPNYSPFEAHLICAVLSISYVASLYLIPKEIRILPRNNTTHVLFRLLSISFVTITAVVFLALIPRKFSNQSYWLSIGFRLDTVFPSAYVSTLLMCIFYLGPILVWLIVIVVEIKYEIRYNGILHLRRQPQSLYHILSYTLKGYRASSPDIIHLRNLVVAPISEEIVFRGLMLGVLISSHGTNANYDGLKICLIATTWFAIAHVHHFLEKIGSGMSLLPAITGTIIQVIYTSIFGTIAGYILIRTGNIIAPIVCHVICNYIGLPDLDFVSSSNSHLSFLYNYRYYLLLVHALGLLIFVASINSLTMSLSSSSAFLNTKSKSS